MRNRIPYIFLLLAISLRLAAVDYTVSITTNACGNTQTYTILEGEQMVLHAHPIAGYTFSQWSDGNTDNPRIVTITSDVSYAAEFVATSVSTTYDVTVYADGCTPKVIPVAEGEQIMLNAHAKSGYTFSQWSDGNTDNPRMAIINADATFVAQFQESDKPAPEGQYTITVKTEGCSTELTQNVSAGTEVKLYAHPNECNYFFSWSDGNTDNPRTVIVDGDATYTANFAPSKYIITFVNWDNSELYKADFDYGTTPVYGGAVPTKPADAQYTYTFDSWSPNIHPVQGDDVYTAVFSKTVNQYTVTFNNWDGTPLATYQVEYGQTPEYSGELPTKAATDEYTYTFSAWTPAIVAVNANVTYTAEFVEEGKIGPTWQILYTSSDGDVVTPYKTDVFGANIVSNTYQDGQGVITFDGPVTSIGEYAFHYCIYLTSVNLPESVTSIGYGVFYHCESLTSITIPNSVTSIGEEAFAGCAALSSITIPNSVTTIGKTAFRVCGLRSITIPNSVESLGSSAFLRCPHLTSVTIGNGIKSIGVNTFGGCAALTSVTIGSGVTSIGENAFQACSSLTSITIPESVTSIGNSAFSGCDNLKTVYVKAQEPPVLGE